MNTRLRQLGIRWIWTLPLLSASALAAPCGAPAGEAQRDVEGALYPMVYLSGETQPEDLKTRMAHHQVPGFAMAVIRKGELAWSAARGQVSAGGPALHCGTLFQAGSLAKPLTVLTALRLEARSGLNLDSNRADLLVELGIKSGPADAEHPVTLRGLLQHRAGLTPGGYLGYAQNEAVPTLEALLRGTAPANTPRPEVVRQPGSRLMYSGAGYSLAQLLLERGSGQSFDRLMQRELFAPLGLAHADFKLRRSPARPAAEVAWGHDEKGQGVPGGWRLLPEAAAAGLWANAEDLARVLVELRKAWQGRSKVWPASLVRALLERPSSGHAYGFRLVGEGEHQFLVHYGGTVGYSAGMAINLHSGEGAVYLANGEGGRALGQEFLMAVSRIEAWPQFQLTVVTRAPMPKPDQLQAWAGRYVFPGSKSAVQVVVNEDTLALLFPNGDRYELTAIDGPDRSFVHLGTGVMVRFVDAPGRAPRLQLYGDEAEREGA